MNVHNCHLPELHSAGLFLLTDLTSSWWRRKHCWDRSVSVWSTPLSRPGDGHVVDPCTSSSLASCSLPAATSEAAMLTLQQKYTCLQPGAAQSLKSTVHRTDRQRKWTTAGVIVTKRSLSASCMYTSGNNRSKDGTAPSLQNYVPIYNLVRSIKAASIHQFTRVLMSTSSQLTDRWRGADELPQINVLIFYFTRIKYLTYSAICIYIYQQTHDFSFHSFSPLPYFLLLIGAVQLIKCH